METKILSTGIKYSKLPEIFKWPESKRPVFTEPSDDTETVPIIDLSDPDRSTVVLRIRDACKTFGFFQVVNHGVGKEVAEGVVGATEEFFGLPVEEKMKLYTEEPGTKTTRLATSFNVKDEEVRNWRDYLFLHCWPLDKYAPEWPSMPPSFREILRSYCMEIRTLGFRIEELISESLGLEKDYIARVSGEHGQRMAINYYPPCPEPDKTFGLQAHTDPNTLTILLQDTRVCGLQVLKDGKWLPVKPHPHAFVVNIGDQLQALSNGIYKSGWHRAIVNADMSRISLASFLCPADEALISAPPSLVADGSPSVYRDFTYVEYQKTFWSRKLDQEHCLELFKN